VSPSGAARGSFRRPGRPSLLLLAAFAIGLAVPARAQDIVRSLLDRIENVDPATTTEADCLAKVAAAPQLNAEGLFHGAFVCYVANKPVEGNFLFAAGQIRGMADMGLMEAASEADQMAPSALYGAIWFHLGGPGQDEVFRDPVATARLFRLLDAWTPEDRPDYNPGWNVGRRPDAATYQSALADGKARRRRQLVAIARAYSDPEYYALHREFAALQQRVRIFQVGTPEERQANDLQRRMGERARVLGLDFDGDGEPDAG